MKTIEHLKQVGCCNGRWGCLFYGLLQHRHEFWREFYAWSRDEWEMRLILWILSIISGVIIVPAAIYLITFFDAYAQLIKCSHSKMHTLTKDCDMPCSRVFFGRYTHTGVCTPIFSGEEYENLTTGQRICY